MSISTSAKIVVGYTYDEIYTTYERWKETVDAWDCHFYEWTEDNDLTTVFPYYDAPYECCLFGVSIQSTRDYDHATLNIDDQEIEDISQKYFSKFEKYPKTFLSTSVW